MVAGRDYKDRVAWDLLEKLMDLFNNQGSASNLEPSFVSSKYNSSIKQLLLKYDNPSEVDKLSRALEKTDLLTKKVQRTFEELQCEKSIHWKVSPSRTPR